MGTASSWQMLTTPHGGEAVSQLEEAHSYRPSAYLHYVKQEREQGRGMGNNYTPGRNAPSFGTEFSRFFFGWA